MYPPTSAGHYAKSCKGQQTCDFFAAGRRSVTSNRQNEIMEWTPPSCDGIEVSEWKWVQSTNEERSIRNEDYDNWHRFGKVTVDFRYWPV
jgi:hypothetical protein